MALINRKDIRTNKVVTGAVNNYCKMCLDKAVKESGGKETIHEIKKAMANNLNGERVFKTRITGIDHYFCKECWNDINKELNPEIYKEEEEKENGTV